MFLELRDRLPSSDKGMCLCIRQGEVYGVVRAPDLCELAILAGSRYFFAPCIRRNAFTSARRGVAHARLALVFGAICAILRCLGNYFLHPLRILLRACIICTILAVNPGCFGACYEFSYAFILSSAPSALYIRTLRPAKGFRGGLEDISDEAHARFSILRHYRTLCILSRFFSALAPFPRAWCSERGELILVRPYGASAPRTSCRL